MKISKILCCVDTDPLAESVFDYALALATDLKAELAILSVLDQKQLQMGDSGIDAWTLKASIKEEISHLFDKLQKKAANLTLTKFSEEGIPATTIVDVSNNWSADLIVVASHSRTGIPRLIMGSVAESVLRHAKCPVLVVPAKK
ncbi:MAG: hypothetical protein RJB66_993 [Pseudomonadota bacterium]|jgi:nucleotide-binding universal stress UspA family protein